MCGRAGVPCGRLGVLLKSHAVGLALSFMDFTPLHKVRAHKASSNASSRKAGSWPASKHALRVGVEGARHAKAQNGHGEGNLVVAAQEDDLVGSGSKVVTTLKICQQRSKMERAWSRLEVNGRKSPPCKCPHYLPHTVRSRRSVARRTCESSRGGRARSLRMDSLSSAGTPDISLGQSESPVVRMDSLLGGPGSHTPSLGSREDSIIQAELHSSGPV